MCCLKALSAGFLIALASAAAHAAPGDQLQKILPADGAFNDNFGRSVSLADGILVVGAPGAFTGGALRTGAVYMFNATTGAELAKLISSDGDLTTNFGGSVAIADGLVCVGATGYDGVGINSGAAYVFDVATNAELFRIEPNDVDERDIFGSSVAIWSGIIAVGAPGNDSGGTDTGAAYLFDAGTGAQLPKLLPDDGDPGQRFGSSIALADGVVVVGSPLDQDSGPFSGSAYLFDIATGAQIAKLVPGDLAKGDNFGTAVAISGGVVAVGATGDDDNGPFSGSVYLFDAMTGTQISKIQPDDPQSGEGFGQSIDICGGLMLVGAPFHSDPFVAEGAAYLFDLSTGMQLAKIQASDAGFLDLLGSSVALADGIAAAGAVDDDDNGEDSGSAYIFDAVPPCALTDLAEPFGQLDFSDITAFLTAFGALAPEADLAEPMGQWDFSDVVAFLTLFGAGCP